MRTGLIVFGVLNLALGGLMVLSPDTFFEQIGPYGAQNNHYLGDVGAFYLAAGAGLVLAANRPSWRAPLLLVAALWYGFHTLNHLFDIGENNESDARGIGDTVLLGLGTAALAYMARVASRAPAYKRTPSPPGGDYPPGD